MVDRIEVQENGRILRFSFDEMLRYSGPGSPGGVALGFKLMERAFAVLEPDVPVERREVSIETAFRGPGARDACELATRALTDGRYTVDARLERPERGHTLQTFAFRVRYRERSVALFLRQGFVTDEFVRLAQTPTLSTDEHHRFVAMKEELAASLMAASAADVFESE